MNLSMEMCLHVTANERYTSKLPVFIDETKDDKTEYDNPYW